MSSRPERAGFRCAVRPEPAPAASARACAAYFLTGLVVAGPVAITVWMVWSFVTRSTTGCGRSSRAYQPETYLPFQVPGFGLVIALVGLTLLGFLTANLVGRTLSARRDDPRPHAVVRGIYRSVKQIFETMFSQSGSSFRTRRPRRVSVARACGRWCSSRRRQPVMRRRCARRGTSSLGVFMPCTPNPTTGFFFYLPRARGDRDSRFRVGGCGEARDVGRA